jgi:hypothetical protein
LGPLPGGLGRVRWERSSKKTRQTIDRSSRCREQGAPTRRLQPRAGACHQHWPACGSTGDRTQSYIVGVKILLSCSDARARLFLFQTAIPYRASSQLKHVFEETGDVSPKTRSPAQVTQGFFLRATTAMHNSPLDDGQIKVMRCPYCGYESRKMLAWAHGRARFQCAGCGEQLTFHKHKALDAVIRAFKDLRRKVS